VVVNALSRKYEEGSIFSLSFIIVDWLQVVHQEWLQDPKLSCSIQQLYQDPRASLGYSWHNEEFRYKGFPYLSNQSHLKSTVIFKLHASPTTRHSSFHKTYEWLKRSFFWAGMKHDICTFVVECDTCQCNKAETIKTLSML
jgi:hypothetical protein